MILCFLGVCVWLREYEGVWAGVWNRGGVFICVKRGREREREFSFAKILLSSTSCVRSVQDRAGTGTCPNPSLSVHQQTTRVSRKDHHIVLHAGKDHCPLSRWRRVQCVYSSPVCCWGKNPGIWTPPQCQRPDHGVQRFPIWSAWTDVNPACRWYTEAAQTLTAF